MRGAELAVEDLRRSGDVPGGDVELVVVDSGDLTDLPRRLADLAERARVAAVVGPETTGLLTGPRSPLTRRGVPAVLPSAFAGELDGASTVLRRIVPSAHAQAERLARWLRAERDATQLAVLVADPVEGEAARQALTEGASAGGLPPVEIVTAAGDASELASAVAALRRRAPDADALLLWGWPASAARATVAVRELDWDVQVAVGSSAFVGAYRGLAGDASEGVVLPFPFDESWFGPELTRWMLRYQAGFGLGALPGLQTLVLDVPAVALASYDAVGAVVDASTRAASTDPQDVAAALADGTPHPGLLRDYDLAEPEAWDAGDLHVGRFHRLGVVFDVDPRLDADAQRTFWELQTSAEFLRELAPSGPVREMVDRILGEADQPPPTYRPPAPPPGPVARPDAVR